MIFIARRAMHGTLIPHRRRKDPVMATPAQTAEPGEHPEVDRPEDAAGQSDVVRELG
jgi:hypothetical protein